MASVLDLVTEALVAVHALAEGESPGATMANNGLVKFNEVLDALSLQNLAVYSNTQSSIPLSAGVAGYTIGPTGSFVGPRPPFVDAAFVRYQGVDFPVMVKTDEEYALLPIKTQQGMPEWLVYDPTYPNGTITLWPVPFATATLIIYQNTAFTNAGALADVFAMPPGYRKMIRLMLAWELASDYPGMSTVELNKLDGDTKAAIALVKRNNKKPSLLRSETALMGRINFVDWRLG